MFNSYDKNKEFNDFIKDYISINLEGFTGQNVYACELANTITSEDNVNGTIFVYTKDNKEFIKNNWDEASITYNYLKEKFDMVINPFEEPSKFAFCIVDKSVQDVLCKSDYLNKHWNDNVTLSPETINQIKKECGIEYDGNTLDDISEQNEEDEI